MRGRKPSAPVDYVAMAIEGIMGIMEPTLIALNEAPERQTNGDNDAGHAKRIEHSFRFFLQSAANTLQHNLVGEQQGTYLNAEQQLTKSDAAYRELVRKHEGDDEGLVLNPAYDRIARWFKVNDCRVTSLKQLFTVIDQCFNNVTGTQVKPIAFTRKDTAVGVALTEAARKKALELAAELKARVAA